MNCRCYDKTSKSYVNYGGRGITVCKEWRKDNPKGLQNFVAWAERNGYKEGLQLDKDIKAPHKKRYSPSSCAFVTPKQNSNSRRVNVFVTIYWGPLKGQTMTFKQAWENIGEGCSYHTATGRYIRLGWPLKEALTKRSRGYTKLKEEN